LFTIFVRSAPLLSFAWTLFPYTRLFGSGAGTRPGGGIMGASGRIAAMEILGG
jgi:phytoene dehydrogenase-like protein